MKYCCQFHCMVGCALSRRGYSDAFRKNDRRLGDSLGFVKFRRRLPFALTVRVLKNPRILLGLFDRL